MGRLMAIDFGRKRCGIAVTDSAHIVATPLTTVATASLAEYVKDYVARESVEVIVAGEPRTMRGEPSESTRWIEPALARLRRMVPDVPVVRFDERFTSRMAHRSMIDMGMKKSDRRDKAVVDQMSAAIILNDYLQSRDYLTKNE